MLFNARPRLMSQTRVHTALQVLHVHVGEPWLRYAFMFTSPVYTFQVTCFYRRGQADMRAPIVLLGILVFWTLRAVALI